jgi:hypothetical protein
VSYATLRSTSTQIVASLALALALTFVAQAAGAVAPRSATGAATGAAAQSLSLPRPGGAQPGDVMLAAVSYRLGGSAATTAPAGWSLVRSDTCSGPGQTLQTQRVYVRLVTGSEPSAYAWQFPSATGASGVVVSYAGVDAAAPVSVHGGGYTRNSAWVRAESVTTTVPNARVVVLLGRSAAAGIAAPSGTTGHAQAVTTGGPAASLVVADSLQASAGATGNRAVKTSVIAACNLGQIVALRPAATASTPPPSPPPPAPAPAPAPTVTPPTNTASPSVSGAPTAGSTLTATTGTWSGTTPMGFSFSWKRCQSGTCAAIGGANAQSYVAKADDAGFSLRASVTASNGAGSATSDSAPTGAVTVPSVAPPSSVAAPVVSGSPVVGSSLTATTGSWTGATPMTYAYQWSRCSTAGDACAPIGGATGAGYAAVAGDVGSTLRVTVTASNAFGLMASQSAPTATVAAAPVPQPEPGGSTGTVVLTGRGWTCDGPVDLDLVKVTSPSGDAIVLAEGCTGRIDRIEVDTWTTDGVKVQNAGTPAHDVVIGGGYVACHAIAEGAHQDAVQAMGGARIAFLGVSFDCLGNSNFFVKRGGSGAMTPTDITCDGCVFAGNSSTTVRVESSIRSGARNSVGCVGRNVRFAFYATAEAQEPVSTGNRELPHDDPGCAPRR